MSVNESKAIVRRYFEVLAGGEGDLVELLHEDIRWSVPSGSDMAGEKRGRDAVLTFLGSGVDYYDPDAPMDVSIRSMIAEEGRVACEFTLEATTSRGRAYRNEYHFVFEIDAGRIRAVREYLDTHYAHLAFHSEE